MRIVRIRHKFYPDMPKDYFYELSAKQASRGHEVHVITGGCKRKVVEFSDGFYTHHLPSHNIKFGDSIIDYPLIPSISSEIKSIRPDIIHIESHLFLTSLQAVITAKKNHIPCILSVHGVLADRNKFVNSLQWLYLKMIGYNLWQLVDSIICLTKSDKNEIISFGAKENKIFIIPNAVDTDLFKPLEKDDENIVIWTGRFVEEKGLKYLIESAYLLKQQLSCVKFLLIGYGPNKSDLIEKAKIYDLLDCVSFEGPLSREIIALKLGRSTVYAFPSIKEGYPISVLEAMAAGLPIVGTRISGLLDMINNGVNGFLVFPRDTTAFANKLFELLTNKELRDNFGKNARGFVKDNNNWSKILSQIEAVYRLAIMKNNDALPLDPD